MSNKTYGRNRESIADIELELHNLFIEHPDATIAEDGNPVIPGDALVDIFRSFADLYDGMELLTPEEMDMLKALIASNPGMEVTPQVAIAFIAEKTKHTPPQSPPMDEEELPRGRDDERGNGDSHSRSSSNDSTGTHRNHSRPPSRGTPQTPRSAASPFDTSRRQRSTPLGVSAPSSWAKRPPHHRRKSDAGSRSDSEQPTASPSAFGRPAGRMRAPSNPTSPSSSMADFSLGSPPPGSHSRPSSRAQSHGRSHNSEEAADADHYDYTLRQGLSSLPMPRGSDSDSDSDDGGGADMVMDRSAASSTVSMMPHERVEALQRVNDDLARKLADTERMMQRKLAEQEAEFEDLQVKLEETRNELSAAKREEKELRSKERQNSTQIGALEAEVVKVSKQLEVSKASYNNLQRQYMDQCASAEKYRNDLREREEMVRSLRDAAGLTQIEIARYAKEHETYEERIAQMEKELAVAQQAHAQLDEQKQENMLLKETIDRMRFDLDEMRNNSSAAAAGGSSGQSSAANTMSKSLGAELLGKMKGGWGGMESESEEEEEEEEPSTSSSTTPGVDDDDTEGEDVIQTIITRKKRKVASRANKIETRTFEELKEYSDSSTQYEPHLFLVSSRVQTDPAPKILTASATSQTDPEPVVEPPPAPNTAEMEIQTEPEQPQPEASTSAAKAVGPASTPTDAPPAYKQVLSPEEQEEHDWRVTVATLKKYHPGARVEEGVPGGVSLDALEDWRALKEELGVSCLVVDKILDNSPHTGLPRAPSDVDPTPHRRGRSGRFYNIYNTYVYGGAKAPHSNANPFPAIPQPALWVGGTVLFFLMLGPTVMIPYYTVPGGPTHYDRAVWSSFNTMQYAGEGFASDGTEAVWSFIGRVGGGAARMVRGWPT
ncbi:hypothetical protein B0H11DRAFT_1823594 [Mycena galericulata]|nr:hypothetical protein B0H11DRAFT_1882172 [Mycena galericulata]KAJ7447073.1 hypothetical protein B0H11DRAFT_1823594 [Mycena galericulata]